MKGETFFALNHDKFPLQSEAYINEKKVGFVLIVFSQPLFSPLTKPDLRFKLLQTFSSIYDI